MAILSLSYVFPPGGFASSDHTRESFDDITTYFAPINLTSSLLDLSAVAITTTGIGTFGKIIVDNISIDAATILSDTGAISFGDENLTTTGILTATSFTTGTLTVSDGSIDDTDGSIAFGATNFTGVGTINATSLTTGNLTVATGSITDSLGTISFVDENLTTTGLITTGSLDVDTLNLNANVISDSTGTISFDNDNLTTTGSITGTGGLISGGNIVSDTANTDDLGTSAVPWKNLILKTGLILQETGAGTDSITLAAPAAIATSYSLTLPAAQSGASELLQNNGSGVLSWVSITGAGGATLALDNLASVAINTSLLSDSDNVDNLGDATHDWKDIYFQGELKSGAVTLATATEVGYLTGVTAAIQTQLDAKVNDAGNETIAGIKTFSSTILAAAGTAANVSYGFVDDPNTGLDWISADKFAFMAGGTNVFDISSGGFTVNNGRFFNKAGSALAPEYTSSVDPNSGMTLPGSDVLQLSTAGAAGLAIDANGSVTKPKQPAFLVHVDVDIANVTGDGTAYGPVVFDTETFDVGSNFGSNQFVAPATGKYHLNTNIYFQTMGGSTNCWVRITTSNRNYTHYFHDTGAHTVDNKSMAIAVLTDMDANDTADVTISVSGITKIVDIAGGTASALISWFSGTLAN